MPSSENFDVASSAGLFVGISKFEDDRIYPIPFAVDDAVDLAHLFAIRLGLVLPESVVLLLAGEPRKDASVKHLKELLKLGARRDRARMPDFYRYLGRLTRSTEAKGLFILAAATHGISDQGNDFLIAEDSLRDRALKTAVSVSDLFDEAAKARAERRVVLLDACRERLSNNTRGDDACGMEPTFAKAIAQASGLVVLSGATLGGFAYDDAARKNGVFTAAVLDGLGGEASAGPQGWITVRTLADFVQNRVVAWVRLNRPEHMGKSLGIARRIEATAESLPLAPHPQALRERQLLGGTQRSQMDLVEFIDPLGQEDTTTSQGLKRVNDAFRRTLDESQRLLDARVAQGRAERWLFNFHYGLRRFKQLCFIVLGFFGDHGLKLLLLIALVVLLVFLLIWR